MIYENVDVRILKIVVEYLCYRGCVVRICCQLLVNLDWDYIDSIYIMVFLVKYYYRGKVFFCFFDKCLFLYVQLFFNVVGKLVCLKIFFLYF